MVNRPIHPEAHERGIAVVHVQPVSIGRHVCIAVEVELPKTRLIAIQTGIGYIMCGALDIHLLNTVLHDRGIIAARAVGVKSVGQLLAAPLESVTDQAAALGIQPGMRGEDALRIMCQAAGEADTA
jgi:uncharacterized protein YunC (DUF1805 family)